MTPKPLLLAAVLALLVASAAGAITSGATAPLPAPDTPEGVLSFADALLAQGESFRAVTEYQRFLHHFPASPAVPRALEGLGKAYAQANRWEEAIGAFQRFAEVSPSAEARRLLGAALYRGGRHADAARVLLPPGGITQPGDPEAALGTLALLRGGLAGSLAPGARPELAAEFAALPEKNPTLAGGLAAALPGAGHLYVERPRDALVAFLLNASFLWGTWEAARREEWALAGILGFVELGWYSGNVVSAMNGAHKWNRREERRFFDRHEAGLIPAWSLAPLPRGIEGALVWAW